MRRDDGHDPDEGGRRQRKDLGKKDTPPQETTWVVQEYSCFGLEHCKQAVPQVRLGHSDMRE